MTSPTLMRPLSAAGCPGNSFLTRTMLEAGCSSGMFSSRLKLKPSPDVFFSRHTSNTLSERTDRADECRQEFFNEADEMKEIEESIHESMNLFIYFSTIIFIRPWTESHKESKNRTKNKRRRAASVASLQQALRSSRNATDGFLHPEQQFSSK